MSKNKTDDTPDHDERNDEGCAQEQSRNWRDIFSNITGRTGYIKEGTIEQIQPRVGRIDLSALSYITCNSCKETYVKGEDHKC